jgi:hypothetical protein
MERRTMIALPGIAALVAGTAFTQSTAPTTGTTGVSAKALTKLGGKKSVYKTPKSAKKAAKYLNSVNALLTLNAAQQQQATAIFTAAAGMRTSIKTGMKALYVTLGTAVKNNDMVGISQASQSLSLLVAQNVQNGAQANAAFFQLLTPAQQATLSQLTA